MRALLTSFLRLKHKFFILSVLLFASLAILDIAFYSQNLLATASHYPQLICVGLFFFALKAFIITFQNLFHQLETGKWINFGLDLVIISGQIFVLQVALDSLTRDTYPQTAFALLTVAGLLSLLQISWSDHRRKWRIALPMTLFYGLAWLALFQKLFDADVNFLKFLGAIVVVGEVTLFFWSLHHQVKPTKSNT